jgi:hypothetical protein
VSILPLAPYSYWNPPSDIIIHKAYEVAEDREPNSSPLASVISNVNSSVNGLKNIRNTPTQKPTHIGQLKK